MMPIILIQIVLFVVPVYFIVGLDPRASKFWNYLLTSALHIVVATVLGLTIGSAVKNVQVGQIIAPLVAVVCILFGGLFVNVNSIGSWISWLQYVSPIGNTTKALTQNEFGMNTYECGVEIGGRCLAVNGEDVVVKFGLDSPGFEVVLCFNLGILFVLILAGIWCFGRTTKPMIRLH